MRLCSIADIVERIKEAGKTAVVHLDLIAGLSTKDAATDFIRRYTRADGIITTKSSLIAHANELGLGTICRYFILDSMALETVGRISFHGSARPDLIEIQTKSYKEFLQEAFGLVGLSSRHLRRADQGQGGHDECLKERCLRDLDDE